MTTSIRRGPAAALLVLVSVLALVVGVGAWRSPEPAEADSPRAAPRLAVPAPTGPKPVGATRFALTDTSRPDPWVPAAGDRQVVVTLHYPAVRGTGGAGAPYLTPAESAAFLDFQQEQLPVLADVPRDALSEVVTRSRADAEPRLARGGRPLVVLSPGFSLPAATLTGLAVDLASRGYVVASLDHPYESSGLELDDGTLTTCVACETEDYSRVARIRARDTSFVLDSLTAPGSPWHRLIDPARIAMAGHSIGGNTAAVADRRVRAAVDLDGTMFEPARHVHRPLLLLGTTELHRPGGEDSTWDRDWARRTGPGAWFTVARTGHFSFTDSPVLLNQLGLTDDTLPGRRISEITRATVGAFLDRHLRGRSAPALAYPELRLEAGAL